MNPSNLRNDMLTKGAIIGGVMLAASIAETSLMYYGGISLAMAAGLVVIVSFALYCYLVYRFTKNYANLVLEARKEMPYFTYGNGLAYIILISMLAGIITSLGGYIFLHQIVGYEEYMEANVKLIQDALTMAQLPASMAGTYNAMIEGIKSQPAPSLFSTILSGVWSYLMLGTIVGLVVAAFTKRKPVIFGEQDEQ